MKAFYTVHSWHIVTCLSIDVPKFYGKCERNAAVMHVLLGLVFIVTDVLSFSCMVEYSIQSGFPLSFFTLRVSFITLFSIKSAYGGAIHYFKITTSVCPWMELYEG